MASDTGRKGRRLVSMKGSTRSADDANLGREMAADADDCPRYSDWAGTPAADGAGRQADEQERPSAPALVTSNLLKTPGHLRCLLPGRELDPRRRQDGRAPALPSDGT